MRKIFFCLFIICNIVAKSQQITYTPMTAAGYQFKYLKVDSGTLAIPFGDTAILRGIARPGSLVCFTGDSLIYGFNGRYFAVMGADVSSLITLINRKVDSVTINAGVLNYWKQGVSYGSTLPVTDSTIFITYRVLDSLKQKLTLQDIFNNGSTLTKNDTINAKSHNLLIDTCITCKIRAINGTNTTTLLVAIAGGGITSTTVSDTGSFVVAPNQISFSQHDGNYSFDNLAVVDTTTANYLMGVNSASGDIFELPLTLLHLGDDGGAIGIQQTIDNNPNVTNPQINIGSDNDGLVIAGTNTSQTLVFIDTIGTSVTFTPFYIQTTINAAELGFSGAYSDGLGDTASNALIDITNNGFVYYYTDNTNSGFNNGYVLNSSLDGINTQIYGDGNFYGSVAADNNSFNFQNSDAGDGSTHAGFRYSQRDAFYINFEQLQSDETYSDKLLYNIQHDGTALLNAAYTDGSGNGQVALAHEADPNGFNSYWSTNANDDGSNAPIEILEFSKDNFDTYTAVQDGSDTWHQQNGLSVSKSFFGYSTTLQNDDGTLFSSDVISTNGDGGGLDVGDCVKDGSGNYVNNNVFYTYKSSSKIRNLMSDGITFADRFNIGGTTDIADDNFVNSTLSVTDNSSYSLDPSVLLNLSSTDKGLMLPYMTEDQAIAIGSVADGLLIYCWDGGEDGNGRMVTNNGPTGEMQEASLPDAGSSAGVSPGEVLTVVSTGRDIAQGAQWLPPADSRPYKALVGIINQSGTSDPTLTVLENTIGGTFTPLRDFAGNYHISSTASLTSGKTTVFVSPIINNLTGSLQYAEGYYSNASTIGLNTYNASGVEVENGIINLSMEIRVYP